MIDVAGLRKLLDIYAYGKGEYPCSACEILRCVPALLAVAEAAEDLRERDVFYESYADCTDADLTLDAIELRDMWLRFTAALAAPADAGTEEGG